jgi:methylase of polypeptide subunit release factors
MLLVCIAEAHAQVEQVADTVNTVPYRQACAEARGRILDIGAGAGRAALYLQETGRDVVAPDVSPGAVDVCKRRGVRRTVIGTVEDLAVTRTALDMISSRTFDGRIQLVEYVPTILAGPPGNKVNA